MWRKTLLTATVLLFAQSLHAQGPSFPPAGGVSPPPFLGRSPAVPGFNGPAMAPITGTMTMPGATAVPPVTPSSPFLTAPAGPNPALTAPQYVPMPPSALENTVAFDPDQAELRWQDNRWQLASGNVVLKDFGRYEAEGREVLRVVRELRLNTLTTLGAPRPIMEYWLSNGEAPHGQVSGLRTLSLDVNTLTAEQVQGQWCIRDGSRILFNFAQQGDACRQALAMIQRYGFNQVGYVGQVSPVMLVFLANPTVAAPIAPASAPPPPAHTSHFPDLRFPHVFGNQDSSAKPDGSAAQPAQPGQMPNVPAQSLNTPPGMPLKQPGAIAPVGLRLRGSEAADRIAIDAARLQVHRDGNDWKLAMGSHVVANFGPNQADAQLAQAALRYYHVTEQVFVGNPRPVFSYFLSSGQAPHGSSYAFNAVTFRPESLSVRQLGASYVLYDGSQVVMSFGERMAEAQQVLQVIQQHKFDRLTTFGRGDQSMMMLVRTN